MHIGYIKQGGILGLDFYGKGTSVGGLWERYVILTGGPARGHKVSVYSPILKADLHLLENFPGVEYLPNIDKIPESIDILYVENGPDNYTFTGSGSVLPLVPRMLRLIANYKGLIIYDYPDVLLRPTLVPEAYSPKTYKYLDFATAVNLFENKAWVITSKSYNHTLAGAHGNSLRSPIELLQLPTAMLNLVCFLEEFRRRPVKTPKWDLVYSGNERPRKGPLLKWYGNPPPGISSAVYGKWKDVSFLQNAGIEYQGSVSMGALWELFSKCLVQVYLTDEKFLESRALTDRAYEVIQGGCLLFMPLEYQEVLLCQGEGWLEFDAEAFCVNSPEDLHKAVKCIKQMSWAERIYLNEVQLKYISADTPLTRMREFEAVVEDHINLPQTQPEAVLPKLREVIRRMVLGDLPTDTARTKESKEKRRALLKGRYDWDSCELVKPFGEIVL